MKNMDIITIPLNLAFVIVGVWLLFHNAAGPGWCGLMIAGNGLAAGIAISRVVYQSHRKE